MSCPDCFKGSKHTHADPAGEFQVIHEIICYVGNQTSSEHYDQHAASSASAHFNATVTQDVGINSKKSTIILAPDAFGIKLVNNLLLADLLATKTGCRVILPDVLHDGGMPAWVLDTFEGIMTPLTSRFDIWGILNKVWSVMMVIPLAIPFVLFGKPKTMLKKHRAWFDAIKKDVDANGGKLALSGYCWGGGLGTILAQEEWKGSGHAFIDVMFTAHPSFVEPPDMVDAVVKYKTPISVAVAEEDQAFDAKKAETTEASLRQLEQKGEAKGLTYEFQIHKGCKHNFAVRARNNEFEMKGYFAAAKQAIDWFNKHLN